MNNLQFANNTDVISDRHTPQNSQSHPHVHVVNKWEHNKVDVPSISVLINLLQAVRIVLQTKKGGLKFKLSACVLGIYCIKFAFLTLLLFWVHT